MGIDKDKVFEIIRSVRPLFSDNKKAAEIREKGLADYVTSVDVTVQGILQEKFGELYPDVQFLAEEKDNDGINFQGKVFIVDPCDGTTNLVHDDRFSCVSVGYVEGGMLVEGFIYQPYTDEMFFSERGKGAFLNGNPIHVSKAPDLEHSLIAVGTRPYQKEYADRNFDLFKRIFMKTQDIRRAGSAALDCAYVACGRLDGYFERRLKPWEFSAGMLLVEEAGGKTSGYQGEAIDFTKWADIVVSNGKIHEALIQETFR